ncbi:MAG: hypothetical protein IID51_13555 [Proteobacteria bacterium]|nr:hypothetical protein [Pseudomonadota bacterium]
MDDDLRPNKAEKEFLTLSYNRFYDIFDEVMNDAFWEKSRPHRFSKIKDGFAVYAELLNYEPIKWAIDHLRSSRPPMEAVIGGELFQVIRNIVFHFPFFDSWDEVWVSKTIINWNRCGQTIDRFLKKHAGKDSVKYRFWEPDKKKMTYVSIDFPKQYKEDEKIYLSEILSEKEGVKFSFVLMRQIIDTQVEQ